ncbi:hypothetical protein llap_461 [Limosa lapponica baueri]|uniref:Uncharacterized protein n=1 Tax=Limosa lapponica baueri TaxID=1758121 RepID=A0A2I0UTC6_LIMLA|nr:hypothetical protein llap_461 [Limosa lapponica baueri]
MEKFTNNMEVPMEVSLSVFHQYTKTPVVEKEHRVSPLADRGSEGFTIKASVTNKVTQQEQKFPKSSIFHKIVSSFFTFIHLTSREPYGAGFSSEGARELLHLLCYCGFKEPIKDTERCFDTITSSLKTGRRWFALQVIRAESLWTTETDLPYVTLWEIEICSFYYKLPFCS